MKVLFLDAPYTGTVELCPETLQYFQEKNIKTVALYASVQFCNNLERVKQQLQERNITIVSSQAKRTDVPQQILGCDNYHNSLNLSAEQLQQIDAFLYIGDGKFHPLALAYGQKDAKLFKEIICNDSIGKRFFIITKKDIQDTLNRQRGTLLKFLSAKNIGVIITIKPGQEHLQPSLALEKKYSDKKFYYFIDNTISFDQLENFPFVDVWVNTACPRIGLDDQEQFRKGVLNLNEALGAEELLQRL
ncbi:MAG: diphthamide synthesis protein [Nanoarchaeota archaeon]|nr:diphthamide synthesis protein [Nanoarchaeota archaeon]